MSEAKFQVDFTSRPGEDDFQVDRLTDELADDLRELGEVSFLSAGPPLPGSKGAVEVATGALALVAGTDPAIVQSVVELLAAFLRRNAGRRVHLKVADVELTIDQPSRAETAELIRTVQTAIERSQR
ncbi:hypothetical protein [Actinoplanes sp. TFC3]|uniref:hypothetical protein n=1 Tax=Actinoplanes sp. TFC3 TaxID=1710355 RepID=UPI00082B8087|nr:hypothetical protein [Actinoplanes sp. TFC3]